MAEHKDKKRADYTGVVIGIILLPIVFFFIYIRKEEVGRAVCVDLAAIFVAVRIRWDLKNRPWFWGIVALLLGLHVPLFLLVPWPRGWIPAIAALPFAVVDCLVALGALRFVEKFILKTVPLDEAE